jgi:hypothetical protein
MNEKCNFGSSKSSSSSVPTVSPVIMANINGFALQYDVSVSLFSCNRQNCWTNQFNSHLNNAKIYCVKEINTNTALPSATKRESTSTAQCNKTWEHEYCAMQQNMRTRVSPSATKCENTSTTPCNKMWEHEYCTMQQNVRARVSPSATKRENTGTAPSNKTWEHEFLTVRRKVRRRVLRHASEHRNTSTAPCSRTW